MSLFSKLTNKLKSSTPEVQHFDVLPGENPEEAASYNAEPEIGDEIDAEEAEPPPPPAREIEPVVINLPADYNLDQLLRLLVDSGGSDLHLSVGCAPVFRVDGHLWYGQGETLTQEKAVKLLKPVMSPERRKDFVETGNADFAYEIKEVSRFRGNVFKQFRGQGAVFRTIPSVVPDAEKLGVPPQILTKVASLRSGLCLVTGPTGSGKSTTLASIINEINKTRDAHIITIEDPVEFVHTSKRCLIDHREVGAHASSFADAARASLREDPDVLLLGEMRDLETIYNAVKAAETGVLVFGTLHTNSAVKTVDRIVDAFPTKDQPQIRSMLSQSLKMVVAQLLLGKVGGGRIAAHEILFSNRGVSNLIRNGDTSQLRNALLTGKGEGMRSLDQTLLNLLEKKLIHIDQVRDVCSHKGFFEKNGYRF